MNYRLVFLLFLLCYGSALVAFLILNFSNMPIQWDETPHLLNGLYLKFGMYNRFLNSLFYPPLYDIFTAFFYDIFGISVVSARMVDAFFSVSLLWITFEFANNAYGGKIALFASIFLGIMPGYFSCSHIAMLDIMMVFFFTLSLFFFYVWLQTHKDRLLLLIGLTLGVGFLAKYQVMVAAIVILFALLILDRSQIKKLFSKRLNIVIIIALLSAIIWIFYNLYSSGYIGYWLFDLQIGSPSRLLYSNRFPIPIFYFIEIVSPYPNIHPISFFLYLIGFLGLGLFALRRQAADRLFLICFVTVLVFYTLLGNRQWRYVLSMFPVLAISASVFVSSAYTKLHDTFNEKTSVNKKRLAKFSTGLLILFVITAMVYSVNDIFTFVKAEQTPFTVEEAVKYAISHDNTNQSIMVLCPTNFFTQHIINFYLLKDRITQIDLYSYPESAIDIYSTFNITELINLCKKNNVKFLFISEMEKVCYFNLTIDLMGIYTQLVNSNNFTKLSPEQTFGQAPRRILILNFTG